MQIADLMKPEGRVFLKSEWGQISDRWPCVSFTKKSVGEKLRREFVPGRDVLVYVGTTSATSTENPDHRSRIISAVVVEPKQILETRKIIPKEAWEASVEQHRDRWVHALAVIRAANIVGPPYPDAHDVVPNAYRSFADIVNRGGVVEAMGEERDAVMLLAAEPIDLKLREDVVDYIQLRARLKPEIDRTVQEEAFRMAELIQHRVKVGGEQAVRINPLRTAPNLSELISIILQKWREDQNGLCALCGRKLVPGSSNQMLKPSTDRIDSSNGAYDRANIQVTHLACNLAKNQYGMDHFDDWLSIVRGEEP